MMGKGISIAAKDVTSNMFVEEGMAVAARLIFSATCIVNT